MEGIYVVKLGGSSIMTGGDIDRLCSDVSRLVRRGAAAVLVHGGGPQISAEMERLGMVPRTAGGLRITDRQVLDVTERVLFSLNSGVVDGLRRAGTMAMGMPGYHCTVCRKADPVEVADGDVRTSVDPGLVGEVSWLDPHPLRQLLDLSVVPVVYPIGKDAEGRLLNVNADTMAAGIAAGIGCTEMVTVTDVPGILSDPGDPGSKLDTVTLEDLDRMVADGRISGGMLPKAEACRKAVLSGVPRVRLVDGRGPGDILSGIKDDPTVGTVVTR